MKLVEHFESFLKDTVNLDQTRLDRLQNSVGAIVSFVQNSEWQPNILRFQAQGSWAHRTIIRPLEGKEFDADLVVFVEPFASWDARTYIDSLFGAFSQSGVYKDKVKRYSHCVTIEYAGEFRIDVAVCVYGRSHANSLEVCNRKTNLLAPSDPVGYNDWLRDKDTSCGNNQFIKATRLLKYLRDIKGNFTCQSILFTTLIGARIGTFEHLSDDFNDLPTSLRSLVTRLDDWLQAQNSKPEVYNPTISSEDFSEHWTDDQYSNFRDKIHLYRGWIEDAYSEQNRDESIAKWQRVFGEDFGIAEAKSRAVEAVRSISEAVDQERDIVENVRSYGSRFLALIPRVLPHVQAAPFRKASTINLPVFIRATEKSFAESNPIRALNSGDIVIRNTGIEFTAVQNNGLPFPTDYRIEWQIVNTGQQALDDNSLRGGFYSSKPHGVRFESTLYRGAHWAQAFVLSQRTGHLVGASERFFVVIE